jgi:AmpD protein
VKIEQHYLSNVIRLDSPNCDLRPNPDEISLIVIHCISLPPGQFGGDAIKQFFCNQLDPAKHPYFQQIHTLKVSSHLLIERSGAIVQFVGFDQRAWHAGVSNYQGRSKCNDFSIGIELEGTEAVAYTDSQYQKLAEVCRLLLRQYPKLQRQNIVGHSDIAPGRKTDPGDSFSWERFYHYLDNS